MNFEEFAKAYTHVVTAATQGGGGARVLGGERGGRERGGERKGERKGERGERRQEEEGRWGRGGREDREEGLTELQQTIAAGKRAGQALARKEEEEIARLFNDDPGLAVTARACFDRYDRRGVGYIACAQLKHVFGALGYSTPTLVRDIRTWETAFFNASAVAADQREWRGLGVVWGWW